MRHSRWRDGPATPLRPEGPIQRPNENEAAFLLRAARFAADKHRTQRRKDADASPYINHPLRVAETIAVVGGVHDVVALAAALLHDTIEDTRTTPEELLEHFGAEVLGVVLEVTDDKRLEKAERKRLQVEHAAAGSPRAKLVKLGDKIANLQDIAASPPAHWPLEQRLEYFDWAERVIAGCRGTNAALEAHFDEVARTGREALLRTETPRA